MWEATGKSITKSVQGLKIGFKKKKKTLSQTRAVTAVLYILTTADSSIKVANSSEDQRKKPKIICNNHHFTATSAWAGMFVCMCVGVLRDALRVRKTPQGERFAVCIQPIEQQLST